MKNRSDAEAEQDALQQKLAGLGEYSLRKTYYPELQQRLDQLERFKAFIDHSNDIIFLIEVPSALIVDVNDSASRQMRWSRDELLNNSIFAFSDLAASAVAVALICRSQEGDGTQALAVAELFTKEQGKIPVELTLSRMRFDDGTYVIAAARDISVRRKAEAALRASERFLSNIVDNIPAIVFAKDAKDLRYVAFNKAAEELLGYAREDLLGRTDFDIFPSEQAAAFVAQDRQVLAKGELVEIQEETAKTSRGDDLILRTKKIPLFDDSGVAQYLLGIAEDITERKRLEEQLLQSQKMEAIGRLAGGIAHDFNNILMVIMGYADVLKRGDGLSGPQLENVRKIASASEKAAQLTGNLLTFSRKQVMKTRIANVKEIVLHIEEFVGRIIGEDIQLRTLFSPDDLLVDVDSGQIEQVLLNLATNARDAMPKGGVLTIETGVQELDASQLHAVEGLAPGRYACIAISDTGMGMDEKTRQKIFEPFFTTKEPGKGTGLGMAIVYGILKQHKGLINVYSEPGIGTTFRIYLPLVTLAEVNELPESSPIRPSGGTETILVAEDEADVRSLVEEILVGHGYRVITAINGLDAVEKYAAHRDDVKLVLMDMIMPRMSGKDACERIKQQDPEARVLFISGYTMDFVRQCDLLDERTDLVMKPVQPWDLLRRVREMLDS
ncbi:PAS domain S-box protein [Geobacter pelophilus]|uniref:histidine kinase n=1 Tax=Geoanaerobacter pelophilus TaxID=60036 RepID=A0AAW4L6D3_9BACT|nr:PAS domain-containing sensor histidine kinase [Geoanaerobacter pelophilus]MBT0665112.1 PAS domain S-box protein [Geoanaerobacter pelophilus]